MSNIERGKSIGTLTTNMNALAASSENPNLSNPSNLTEVQPQIGNGKDELVAQNIDIKKPKKN